MSQMIYIDDGKFSRLYKNDSFVIIILTVGII